MANFRTKHKSIAQVPFAHLLSVRIGLSLLLGVTLATQPALLSADDDQGAENTDPAAGTVKVDFDRDIKPIFDNHCALCHDEEGGEAPRIDVKEKTFEFVRVGNAEESRLYEVLITDDEDFLMPPPDDVEEGEVDALTPEQIALVARWINEGALWSGEKHEEPEANGSNDDPAQGEPPAPKSIFQKWWEAIGVFHPAIVHFPIALLLVSAFFAIGSLRGNFVATDVSYYCLLLGALSTIFACALGWSLTYQVGPNTHWNDLSRVTDPENKFFWHGWGGIVLMVLSIVVALMAMSARRRDPDQGGSLWKLGTFVLAGLVGWVGHQGGHLTYGEDFYNPVFKLIAPDWDAQKEDNQPASDTENTDDDSTAESSDAESSGEGSGDDGGAADETADADSSSQDGIAGDHSTEDGETAASE